MQSDKKLRGAILFAHGSRDPLWRLPVEAIARQIASITPVMQVRCAYLEFTQPDLPTCVTELVAQGTTSITVLPLFVGTGKHAKNDLLRLVTDLRSSYPQVVFTLKPAIGEEPQVIELIARIALS